MRKYFGVGAVCAVLAACGSTSGDGSAGGAPTPLEEVATKYAAALCSKLQTCGAAFYTVAFGNEDCQDVFTKRVEQSNFGALKSAVNAGTIKYDPGVATQCLNAVQAAGCEVLENRPPEVCDRVFEGSVAEGGNCELDEDCAGDLRCKVEAACPGKCAPRAQASEACTSNDDCVRGFVCDDRNRCSSAAKSGEPCGAASGADCQTGFLCIEGKCKDVAEIFKNEEGANCKIVESELCKPGLSCVLQGVTDGQVVSKCEKPLAPGAKCRFGAPSPCATGEYCPLTQADLKAGKTEATCVPLPKSGEACAEGFPACAPYTRCGSDGKCGTLQSVGGTCTVDDQCYSENCQNGICAQGNQCSD